MDLTLTVFSFLTNVIERITHALVQSPHYRVAGSSKRLGTGSERLAGVRPVIRISVMRDQPSDRDRSHCWVRIVQYNSHTHSYDAHVHKRGCC